MKRNQESQKGGAFLQFAAMAWEMGITITVGVLGGRWLDSHFNTKPWLTLVFSMISVFAAVYLLIKRVYRK